MGVRTDCTPGDRRLHVRGATISAVVGALAAVSATGLPAAAQGCLEGRMSVAGYCCWPGQEFDVAANRCVGPPTCPTGYAGVGAECEPTGAPALGHEGWSAGLAIPRAPDPAPATEHRRGVGLLTAGGIFFVTAYLGTVITHAYIGSRVVDEPGSWGREFGEVAPLWPLTFFPFVHNLALIGNIQDGFATVMWVEGFIAGAVELAGLAMMIVGENGREVPLGVRAADGWRLSLVPGAPGAEAGCSAVLEF